MVASLGPGEGRRHLRYRVEGRCSLWQLGKMDDLRHATLVACVFLVACSTAEPKACEPPRNYWQKPHNFNGLSPPMNQISLTKDSSIYWNGSKILPARLTRYLNLSHKMNPEPNHFLETETGVSCRSLEALRDRMDQALECKKPYSHCSEGILAVWRDLPTPPGTPIS